MAGNSLVWQSRFSLNSTARAPIAHSARWVATLWFATVWFATVLGLAFLSPPAFAQNEVILEVVDEETGEPIAARIEVVKSAKKLNRDRKMLISGDTWLAEGQLVLQPPPGEYEFLAKRGPEYKEIRGGFTIERRAKDVVVVELPRAVDMHGEQWYSGDMGVDLEWAAARRWQVADAVDMVITNLGAQKRDASPALDPKAQNPRAKNSKAKSGTPGLTGSTDLFGARWGSMSRDILAPEIGIAIHRFEANDHGVKDYRAKDYRATDTPQSEQSDEKSQGLKFHGWRDAWDAIEAARDADQALVEITQPGARDTPFLLADPNVKLVRVLSSVNRPKGDDALIFPRSDDSTSFASVLLGAGKDRMSLLISAPISDEERIRFKGARGIGRLNEFLYWQMLEAGLRLAPSAASGFGKGETHLGYNRVYVYCEGNTREFTADERIRSSGFTQDESNSENEPNSETVKSRSDRGGSQGDGPEDAVASEDTVSDESGAMDTSSVEMWWRGLEHGASFVSNGPLLRAMVNGSPPGSVHPGYRGEAIPLDIAVSLAVREKVDYLDVIFNGESLYNAKLEDHYKRGEFPELAVSESGWLVIRVVTAHEDGYRYASTAPFYFEFEGKPRVSKKSVQFFQGWLERSIGAIDRNDDQRSHYANRKESAREFWDNLQSRATAP